MEKKKIIKILRVIQYLCAVPFIILPIAALYRGFFGIEIMDGITRHGVLVFAVAFLAYVVVYWWIGVLCLILMVLAGLVIRKLKGKEK
jgi:uncharacterized membrane protein